MKSGFVTVIGIPNAGKSSLVNALVEESVSIVTAKAQTTRKRTMGILTRPGEFQIVFVDTPGLIDSTLGLNGFLRREFEESLKDVNAVVATIAPWEFQNTEAPWILSLKNQMHCPVIYVATQVDREIPVTEKWNQWTGGLVPLIATSSKTREGLENLLDQLIAGLPEGSLYYGEDIFTTQNMREMASEIVRKYCFELVHQEIPYGLAVVIQKFNEGDLLEIVADIVLSKESHKGIVIGHGGRVLKEIGTKARLELENMFGRKMFLKLHVVVKPHWLRDQRLLEEFGYGNR